MGLFDSLRDAMHPEDRPDDSAPSGDQSSARQPGDESPKHVDDSAPPEFLDDPSDLERPTGGKHARRD